MKESMKYIGTCLIICVAFGLFLAILSCSSNEWSMYWFMKELIMGTILITSIGMLVGGFVLLMFCPIFGYHAAPLGILLLFGGFLAVMFLLHYGR